MKTLLGILLFVNVKVKAFLGIKTWKITICGSLVILGSFAWLLTLHLISLYLAEGLV